ncbi:MAG: hypothetical protein QXI11_01960 [Thermoproteota archaeon]
MAKIVPLDKTIVQGVEVKTDEREVWIIRKLGTNSTTIGTLKIDRKPTTQISQIVAPLHKTSSNFMGPIDLGSLYNVVLPQTYVGWDGASGSKLRVIGSKMILDPGETVEAGLKTRYEAQFKDYLVTIEGVYSHGTDTAWPADLDREVIGLTPKTTEEYYFNNVIMASVANVSGGVSEGDWAIWPWLAGSPLEYIYGLNIKKGIDVLSMPRPPAETTNLTPFTLADYPIIVLGDQTLSIRAINTSGTTKSPTTGTSITVTVTALARYIRKV